MNLPEYDINTDSFEEYWNTEDEARFACPICDEMFPNHAKYYWINGTQRPVCKIHKMFHRIYQVLHELEHELLNDDFNALTVTLKLSEEGII